MSDERRGNFELLWRRARRVAPFALLFIGIASTERDGSTGTATRGDVAAFGPPTARADIDWGFDTDLDGLPDEVELLVGGSPLLSDTDGDGYSDALEFVCGSKLDDPTSMPKPKPSTRTCAYETAGRIRVFCAVYPANLDMVNTFHCVVGSQNFTVAPEGDPGSGVGIFEITPFLSAVAHSYTLAQNLGLDLVGFSFDFDRATLLKNAPVSIGFASKIADVDCADEITLTVQGSTSLVLSNGPATASGQTSYAIQPLDPSGGGSGGDDPEYCSLGFDSGTPVGVGSVEYAVTSASCAPDGLLFCVGVDCTSMQGQKMMMIDYGYLQSKAGE